MATRYEDATPTHGRISEVNFLHPSLMSCLVDLPKGGQQGQRDHLRSKPRLQAIRYCTKLTLMLFFRARKGSEQTNAFIAASVAQADWRR